MLDRLISAAVAFCLALLVWLYLRSRDQEMLDNVPVPVQIAIAKGQETQYELETTTSSQVPVSFTGPPSRMRELRNLLQKGALKVDLTLTVPEDRLKETRYLETVRVEASQVHPPAGVTAAVSEGRNHISVTLHRLAERLVPVRFEHGNDERISRVLVEPASVTVRGPQEVIDRMRSVPTRQYTMPPLEEPSTSKDTQKNVSVPLVSEVDGRRITTIPATVKAQLALRPRQRVYELEDLAVQFLCPSNFPLRPLFSDERAGKITLRLQGPARDEPPAVTAYIDLCGRKWDAGLYEEALKLQLPKDFQLVGPPPKNVPFQLVATETAVKASPLTQSR